MLTRFRKASGRGLILTTALLLILIYLLKGVRGRLSETLARKDGSLKEITVEASDFEMSGLREDGEGWHTTDNDPQMIYRLDSKLSKVSFTMTWTLEPGEIVMYYMEEGDIGFSPSKRVWAKPTAGDGYEFSMPMKKVTYVRIDPTMYPANHLEFSPITFNRPSGVSGYFRPEASDFFELIIYTGIISSLLRYLQGILPERKEEEKG